MAHWGQHDFVPAWLNFSTLLPTKTPGITLEKHGEHPSGGDARPSVNTRRRHYSSDGFFNSDVLRAPAAGDGWQQPSFLRHDSVDSGVAKGGQRGLGSSAEGPGWHSGPWSPHTGHRPKRNMADRERKRQGPPCQRNGGFFPCIGEKQQGEKLKFLEEDFPWLKPEMSSQSVGLTCGATGVWENPPSAKQTMSKMLVIKKVSKKDPIAAFSAGFANTGSHLTNGSKAPMSGPSVYKSLLAKPAAAPTKTWKPDRKETKIALHFPSRDSAFTNPASVAKPPSPLSTLTPVAMHPRSISPEIDIILSRLKMKCRCTDRKSEFLRGLKDEVNGDGLTSNSPPAPREGEGTTAEPKNYEGPENEISHLLSDSDTDQLSSSLKEEHRLLKAMGWQEPPENDDSFLPLTEDELKEFQAKTEQLKKSRSGQNGVGGMPLQLPQATQLDEGLESESSSQTSDDEADL